MTHDDIRTEARRLGELEEAFVFQASEVAKLKREVFSMQTEHYKLDFRVGAVEVRMRPWYRRLLWFT